TARHSLVGTYRRRVHASTPHAVSGTSLVSRPGRVAGYILGDVPMGVGSWSCPCDAVICALVGAWPDVWRVETSCAPTGGSPIGFPFGGALQVAPMCCSNQAAARMAGPCRVGRGACGRTAMGWRDTRFRW